MSYFLKRIRLVNFLSYEDAVIDFDSKVTIITGLNLTDHGQESNGSGKSGVIEGIYYALSGKSLRGISDKKLIRHHQFGALVELTITGLSEIIITREIFQKSSASCVIIQNDESIPTVSQDDATSWILTELNILNRDELLNSYIVTDSSGESLCEAKESKRREIILRLAKATEVDLFLENAKLDLKNITVELSKTELSREKIKGSLDLSNDNILTSWDRFNAAKLKVELLKEDPKIIEIKKMIHENEETIKHIDSILNKKGQSIIESKEIYSEADLLSKQLKNPTRLEDHQKEFNESIIKLELLLKDIVENQIIFRDLLSEFNYQKTALKTDHGSKLREKDQNYHHQKKINEIEINKKQLQQNQLVTCPKCKTKHLAGHNEPEIEEVLEKGLQKLIQENDLMDSVQSEYVKLLTEEFNEKDLKFELIILEKRTELEELEEVRKETVSSIKILKSEHEQSIINQNKNYLDQLADFQLIKDESEENITKLNLEISKLNQEKTKLILTGSGYKNQLELIESKAVHDLAINEKEYERTKTQWEDLKKEYDVIDQKYILIKSNQAKAKLWVDKFNEFKGWLCRRILTALSVLISDRLARSESDLSVRFDGLRTLANGTQKDEVNLMILRDGLEIGPFRSLSSGEKARVNLASWLAVLDLTSSGSHGFHFLALDEVLDSVDIQGTRGLVQMLSNTNYQVVLISQHELEGTQSTNLKAIKKNKITIIQN